MGMNKQSFVTLFVSVVVIIIAVLLALNIYSPKLWAWVLLIMVVFLIFFPFLRKRHLVKKEKRGEAEPEQEKKEAPVQEKPGKQVPESEVKKSTLGKEKKGFKFGFKKKSARQIFEEMESSYEQFKKDLEKK